MEDSKTSPLFLTGTWPVRTHANRFFGDIVLKDFVDD